jgi:hypothetical protein
MSQSSPDEIPMWKRLGYYVRSVSGAMTIYYITKTCTVDRKHPMRSLAQAQRYLNELYEELSLEMAERESRKDN